MKRKKIIIFIYGDIKEYPPTINAVNILAERNWDITVLNLKETNTSTEINKNVTVKYFGNLKPGLINIFNFLQSVFLLLFYTVKLKPSHILSYDGMSVFASFIASKLTRTKWIYHQHDYWQKPRGWLHFPYWCEMNLTKYADTITFPQKERAELFKKAAKIKKEIIIIYNGPRKNWTANSKPANLIKKLKKQNNSVIIYQGGWAKLFLIQNIITALPKINNVAFIIIGKPLETGIKAYYKSLIKTLDLSKSVFLIESVPYFELPNYTCFCDIGVTKFTYSNNDPINDLLLAGASNKIIEYCACSLSILAPDTPVNKQFIENNNLGLTCNPEITDDIVNKINSLLKNKKRYSEKNITAFNNYLNFDKQFTKFLQVL